MNIISAIPKLYAATRAGLNLKNLYESRTTANAVEGTGIVSIAAGVIVAYLLHDQSTEVQVAVMGLAVSVVAPLVSRILAFTKQPDKAAATPATPKIENADIMLMGVQYEHERMNWRAYSGTILDAHTEGRYDRGTSYAGIIYDLTTGAKIGYRATPERKPDGNPLEQAFVDGVGKRDPDGAYNVPEPSPDGNALQKAFIDGVGKRGGK